MRALVLRCRRGVRYHFGETSLQDTSEILHADTLFSALANVYALAYDAAAEWVGHVEEGRIRFSSGLHCAELSWRPDEPVFFVPRPPLRYTGTADDPTAAKRLRHVRHVSLGVLAEIRTHLRPASPPDEVPACTLDLLGFPRIGGGYACTEAELAPVLEREIPPERLYAMQTLPRVEVRTPEMEDNFYHAAGLTPASVRLAGGREIRGHFYVLVEHALDAAAWQRFLACVRLLADEGVGGERSAGYGWFEEVREASVPLPGEVGAEALSLALAPVVPADDEEFARAIRYDLFLRGGGSLGRRGEPSMHRQRVRMLREGALFQGPARGRLVDVSPENNPFPHPLLRSGIHFPLPLGPAT
jgi:CRISPR-associated protein Csm4